ncbi:MAG: hypothetical protein HYY15_02585 [Candidatus Omnitrophica bacterium]|nr:hypothetical protein [Candidatus Omnitrophota bacterium]
MRSRLNWLMALGLVSIAAYAVAEDLTLTTYTSFVARSIKTDVCRGNYAEPYPVLQIVSCADGYIMKTTNPFSSPNGPGDIEVWCIKS